MTRFRFSILGVMGIILVLDFLHLGTSPDLRDLTRLLRRDHPGQLLTHSVGREAGKTHRSQEIFVPLGEAGKV